MYLNPFSPAFPREQHAGGRLTIDLAAESEALEEAQKRSMQGVAQRDWAGRTADEIAPMVMPTVN